MARTCELCDAESDPDHGTYVEQRSSNQIDPSTNDILCTHCWAGYLRDETTLSHQEAMVAAYKESGLTHAEVAEKMTIDRSQVGTVVGRIRDKHETAGQTAEYVTHPDGFTNGGAN